jgi:hypothetical protein
MMLSDEKVTHMSHVLLRELKKQGLIDTLEDEGKIRRQIRRSIIEELKLGEEIDEVVRRKINSMSKRLAEGSPEWEILYKKFFKEEEKRRGRDI